MLPAEEKLRIIEALWADLVAAEETVISPAWHEAELKRTETDFTAGKVEALDWFAAK